MKRMLNIALVGLTFAGAGSALADTAHPVTQQAAQNLGASQTTEIGFEKGHPELTQAGRDELKKFVESARQQGDLKKIKVAAWADVATPAKGNELPEAQEKLAEKRAENVKSYLKDSLNISDVELYNMGENANSVEKFLGTESAKLKQELGHSKVAMNQKPASALVMAVYK
jgi:outer membrane protein OmpA-like peptidoglycan-associated protein